MFLFPCYFPYYWKKWFIFWVCSMGNKYTVLSQKANLHIPILLLWLMRLFSKVKEAIAGLWWSIIKGRHLLATNLVTGQCRTFHPGHQLLPAKAVTSLSISHSRLLWRHRIRKSCSEVSYHTLVCCLCLLLLIYDCELLEM